MLSIVGAMLVIGMFDLCYRAATLNDRFTAHEKYASVRFDRLETNLDKILFILTERDLTKKEGK